MHKKQASSVFKTRGRRPEARHTQHPEASRHHGRRPSQDAAPSPVDSRSLSDSAPSPTENPSDWREDACPSRATVHDEHALLPRINHFDFAGVPFLVLSLPNPQFDGLEVLTPAEREVAMMMLDGLSNRAIAEQRGSSVRTIANQVAAIFRKLGVGSRSELATMSAKSSKFVHPEDLPNANLKQLK